MIPDGPNSTSIFERNEIESLIDRTSGTPVAPRFLRLHPYKHTHAHTRTSDGKSRSEECLLPCHFFVITRCVIASRALAFSSVTWAGYIAQEIQIFSYVTFEFKQIVYPACIHLYRDKVYRRWRLYYRNRLTLFVVHARPCAKQSSRRLYYEPRSIQCLLRTAYICMLSYRPRGLFEKEPGNYM